MSKQRRRYSAACYPDRAIYGIERAGMHYWGAVAKR